MANSLYNTTKGICKAFDDAQIPYTIDSVTGNDCIRLPIEVSCGPVLTAELNVMNNEGHVIFSPVRMANSIPDHVREIVLMFLNHLNMTYPCYKFCLHYDDSVMLYYDQGTAIPKENIGDYYVKYYQRVNEILSNEYLHLMQVIIMVDQENKDLGAVEMRASDKQFRTFLWFFLHANSAGTNDAVKYIDNLLNISD